MAGYRQEFEQFAEQAHRQFVERQVYPIRLRAVYDTVRRIVKYSKSQVHIENVIPEEEGSGLNFFGIQKYVKRPNRDIISLGVEKDFLRLSLSVLVGVEGVFEESDDVTQIVNEQFRVIPDGNRLRLYHATSYSRPGEWVEAKMGSPEFSEYLTFIEHLVARATPMRSGPRTG